MIFHNNTKKKKNSLNTSYIYIPNFREIARYVLEQQTFKVGKKTKKWTKKNRFFPICEIMIYDWIIFFHNILWHHHFSFFGQIWTEKVNKYFGFLPFCFFPICKINRDFPFFFQYLHEKIIFLYGFCKDINDVSLCQIVLL